MFSDIRLLFYFRQRAVLFGSLRYYLIALQKPINNTQVKFSGRHINPSMGRPAVVRFWTGASFQLGSLKEMILNLRLCLDFNGTWSGDIWSPTLCWLGYTSSAMALGTSCRVSCECQAPVPCLSPAANQFFTVGDKKRTWDLKDAYWERLIKMILKCNLGPTAPQVTGHETKVNYKIIFVGRKNLQKGIRISLGN